MQGYRQHAEKGEEQMRSVCAAVLALAVGPAAAQDTPGAFQDYVLALSWTPNLCRQEVDARSDDRCAARRGLGFTLHGLWPQHESGYPVECPGPHAPPSRALTAAMADLYGSPGLAWHQWQRHGTCSGLSPAAYYARSRQADEMITRPEILRRIEVPLSLSASVIEAAFAEANPGLDPDMLTLACRDGAVHEVRICLTRDLEPRPCRPDVSAECTPGDALVLPVR